MNTIELEKKIKNLIRQEIKTEKAKEIITKLKFFVNYQENYGDISTNLIFLIEKLAPEKKEEVLRKIENKFKNYFSQIKVINNYLNFYFSDYLILKSFRSMTKNLKHFFRLKSGRKRKVIIDYVSANPTGPLTLGNARGAVIGDVLANTLKMSDFRVTKEYYVNDRGLQIELLGKTILAHLNYLKWEENFYQGDYLKEVAQKIKKYIQPEKQNPKLIGKIAANFILKNYIKPSLKKFGTHHDFFLFESDLYKNKINDKVLSLLKRKNLIQNTDGALFLTLTKLGETKDEVIIKRDGEPTYFYSDLLHYYYKFFIKKSNIEILIVASDHFDHIRRLKKALTIFGIKDYQFQPIVYQFVHLKKENEIFKMSKRKGIFVTLDELITKINPGTVRFFFLQKSPEMTIELDLDLAQKESEDNPYWYIQYAYARLNSIINKGRYLRPTKDPQKVWNKLNQNPSIKQLITTILKFQDLLILINKEKKPNFLPEYTFQLAQKIHSFYEKEKILPDSDKLAFVIFLKNFLDFLFKLMEIKPLKKI